MGCIDSTGKKKREEEEEEEEERAWKKWAFKRLTIHEGISVNPACKSVLNTTQAKGEVLTAVKPQGGSVSLPCLPLLALNLKEMAIFFFTFIYFKVLFFTAYLHPLLNTSWYGSSWVALQKGLPLTSVTQISNERFGTPANKHYKDNTNNNFGGRLLGRQQSLEYQNVAAARL